MLLSLLGVFATGYEFELFGKPIDFIHRPETALFYGFIITGILGLFWTLLRFKVALLISLAIALLFAGLFILGKINRGEL